MSFERPTVPMNRPFSFTTGKISVFLEHCVHGPLGYQVTTSLVLVSLELAAVDHLPNAPVCYPEDPGSLAGRVDVFLHIGSIPLPQAFVPVLDH